MWNKIISKQSVAGVGLLLGMGVLVLSGCGKKTTEPDSPKDNAEGAPAAVAPAPTEMSEPAETPTPQPEEALDVPALLDKIANAKDMLQWYGIRTAYLASGSKNQEVDAALAARETALLSDTPVLPISEDLDLIAIDWKLDGSASSEGKEETFDVTWLFRPNEKIVQEADRDMRLVLRGWFDKAHQHYFKPDEKYFQLTYTLVQPVSEWDAGSYQLVTQKTYRKLPNLPYRMHTFFTKVRKTEEGDWAPDGRYGEIADAGWKADLGGGAAEPAQQ